MLTVDLAEREESGWFEIRDGARVQLRLLSAEDVKALRAACVRVVPEYPKLDGRYQRFERTDFDAEKFEEMRLDRCILGWEGLCDMNGVAIPVTVTAKVALMRQVPAFATAVEDGLKALKTAEETRREAGAKN